MIDTCYYLWRVAVGRGRDGGGGVGEVAGRPREVRRRVTNVSGIIQYHPARLSAFTGWGSGVEWRECGLKERLWRVWACAVLTSPRSTISHTTSINEAPGCDGLGEPLVDAPRDSAAEAAAALAAAAAVVGAAPAGAEVVAGAACTVLVAGLGLAGLALAAVDALLLLLLLLATAVPPQKLHVRHLQNLQWLAALETLQKAPHVS